jgi:hypothetical protein
MANQSQHARTAPGVELGFIHAGHTGRPQLVGESIPASSQQRLEQHRFHDRGPADVVAAIAESQL